MADSLASLLLQQQLPDYRLHGVNNHMLQSGTNGKSMLSHDYDCINDDSWRVKIAQWAYEVIDYFDFERDAVAIALNLVDRFMVFNHRKSIYTTMNKRDYQLLTVTAMFLAMKIHGVASNPSKAGAKLTLRVFVELSQRRFTGADIERMELTLLQKLNWRLNPPLPVSFIGCLMDLLPLWPTDNGHHACQRVRLMIYRGATYLAEISVFVREFAFLFSPLVLGYAAILVAMDTMVETRVHSMSEVLPSYDVVERFFRNVFDATSLSPGTEDVSRARSMLFDLRARVFLHRATSSSCRTQPSPCSTTHQWITLVEDVHENVDQKREETASPNEIEHDFEDDSSTATK